MTRKKPNVKLPIHDLHLRHPGLTEHVAGSYLEAARVSLSSNHSPPQTFEVTNDATIQVADVQWTPPDNVCRRAWANRDDATRDGAYACAIAAAEVVTNLITLRRAETLTGADYYVGPPDHSPDDIEGCTRLEVSGTQGSLMQLQRRLEEKVAQAANGRSALPAIAAVVGFRSKCILMRSVE